MQRNRKSPVQGASSSGGRSLLVAAILMAVLVGIGFFSYQSFRSATPGKTSDAAPAVAAAPASVKSAPDAKPDAAPPKIPAVRVISRDSAAAASRPRPIPKVAKVTDEVVRVLATNNVPTPASARMGDWVVREERRDLSESFLDMGNRFRTTGELPKEMEFPLFDGQSVTLTNFEYETTPDANSGVFFAKIKGANDLGHVLFSYVNTSLNGEIHSPSLSLYYEIRNSAKPADSDFSRVFLAQLDPAKMPRCGNCPPPSAQSATPATPAAQPVATAR